MSRTPARRVLQSILSGHWAILPEWLEQFAHLASRLGQGPERELDAEDIRREIRRALAPLQGEEAPAALSFDYGSSLGEETRATVRDGVAIIPIIGPIYHYADALHDVCGCSSYAQVSRDIAAVRQARDERLVKAALFEVDSPGGEVGGCGEAAGLIAELAAEMPTASYVSDLGCSAGYWLTVGTGHVVAAESSMLGSIGVRAAFRRRGSDSTIDIVSSQSPKKVPDVETDAGKAQIRATLDALADVFIDDVARYRGVERDTVLEHFGQGDVVVGRAALEVGMADEIGTFEGTLAALARGELDRTSARPAIRPAARGDSAHATDEEGDMPDPTETPAAETPQPITTVEQLRAAYPALTQQIDSAASDQKAEAERARILGIADLPGDAAVKRACQEDPSCSVGAAAQKILAHQSESAKARARAELAVRAGDEGALDPPAPSSEGGGSDDDVAVQRLLAAARRTGIAVKSTPVHEA